MIVAWRIVKRRHAPSAFDGEGARRFGGRWNSPGIAVVYASATRSLALLEILAGLKDTGTLDAYVLIPARFEESMVEVVDISTLPEGWRRHPPGSATRSIGDAWVENDRCAVLRVPSVIVPAESNYLLNPAHADFARVTIGKPEEVTMDPRLAGRGPQG